MRVPCFTFNNTFVGCNCTLVRVFRDINSLELIFTQSGPKADPFRTEILAILTFPVFTLKCPLSKADV